MVQTAPKYGLQVLLTIALTPPWANGGKTPNYPPKNMNDLTQFSQMLATRYNGSKAGRGVVTRFSVWNEPNLQLFLAPQFNGSKIVSPGIYAKLFMAAYKGIKAGNKNALVAAGETSNRGHNHPTGRRVSDSVAPATFARLVSEANPKLPFDAWATHPYPTAYRARAGPEGRLSERRLLDDGQVRRATCRSGSSKPVPIWVTEYGEQTAPVPVRARQLRAAGRARQAGAPARREEPVRADVHLVHPQRQQRADLVQRPADGRAARRSRRTTRSSRPLPGSSARSQVVKPKKTFSVKVPLPILANFNSAGSKVGMTYLVALGKTKEYIAQPLLPIARDGTVTIKVPFKPAKGKTYTMTVNANDKGGHKETVVIALLPSS